MPEAMKGSTSAVRAGDGEFVAIGSFPETEVIFECDNCSSASLANPYVSS